MLNPDGVICGNYRCSLAAVDLNRRWARPSAKLHPTIHALKKLLLRLHVRQPVALYVDIHGHSRKQRVFMYGCEDQGPSARMGPGRIGAPSSLLPQVFPLLISRVCGTKAGEKDGGKSGDNFFSFGSCNYLIKKAKESTGRVVVHRELSLVTSYTLEASFCGCDERREKRSQMLIEGAPAAEETGSNGQNSNDGSGRATPQVGGPPSDDGATGAPAAAEAPAPSADGPNGLIRDAGGFHFSSGHLMQIGCRFCRALHVYFGLGAPPAEFGAPTTKEKMEELGGLSVSQIDGISQLPNNQSVLAALEELLRGDVDLGGDDDDDGSDDGAGSDTKEDTAEPPAAAPPKNGADAKGANGNGSAKDGKTAGRDRAGADPPKVPTKPAEPVVEAPRRDRRNSVSTRRTREAEMRAAAQRAEAAAAAAAALLGNRPDLLSGPSLPPPHRAMHAGPAARPDHPMPPPPLVQQPSVLQMLQQKEAQERQVQAAEAARHLQLQQQQQQQQQLAMQLQMAQQAQQHAQSHSNHESPGFGRHSTTQPGLTQQPQPPPAQLAPGPRERSASQGGPREQVARAEQMAAGAYSGQSGAEGDDESGYDDDGDGLGRGGASFERGRGFSGKSLSLRSNQWAARSSQPGAGGPGQPRALVAPPGRAPGTDPNGRRGISTPGGTTSQPAGGATAPAGAPQQAQPLQPGSSSAQAPSPSASAGIPKPGVPGVPQPMLKRRPQLPSALGGVEGEDMGAPGTANLSHATPFAELIARRGGEGSGRSMTEGGSNGIGVESLGSVGARLSGSAGGPTGTLGGTSAEEHGLVAGLEMLVSHVRRPGGGGSAGADRGDAADGGLALDLVPAMHRIGFENSRSKSSPVAGRRALPPSATALPMHDDFAADASDRAAPVGGHGDGLSASEVDDAIYSFAASLRAARGARGVGGGIGAGGDGGDDELMCFNAGASAEGEIMRSSQTPPIGRDRGGMPPGGLSVPPQPGSYFQQQPGAPGMARQRWSARDGAVGAPSAGKDGMLMPAGGPSPAGGGGANAAQQLSGNGSWPPRTWHSYGGPGSRPRSVEGGGRPLEPNRGGVPTTRRAAYYSQTPTSDPRLVLQPNTGGMQSH